MYTKEEKEMTLDEVWEKIEGSQGETFRTFRGLDFTYTVKGGCVYISRKDKEVTFSSVKMAYEEAVKLNCIVPGPKKLKCFGASYLYPIFLRIGFIKADRTE